MKLKSFVPLAIAGAICLAIGNIACAAEQKAQASTKSAVSGKSIPEIVTPTKDDVVIWVKVTGSLIPQRFVVRNGQILNTQSNTTMLLTGTNTAASNQSVAGILLTNVPDITTARRR